MSVLNFHTLLRIFFKISISFTLFEESMIHYVMYLTPYRGTQLDIQYLHTIGPRYRLWYARGQ